MTLEDKSIAHSPSLSIDILTVNSIDDRSPEKGYELLISGTGGRLGIPIGKDGREFVEGLQAGTKIMVVTEGNETIAVYGPVDEDRMYLYPRV